MKILNENDAVILFKLDENKRSYDIYLEKISNENKEIKDKEKDYFSKKIEELIATEFLVRTGKKVRRNNKILVSETLPFVTADVKRRLTCEKSILECISSNDKGVIYSESFIIKCQHKLFVSGAEKCYAALLFNNEKFFINEINRDDELINKIISKEKSFYFNYLSKKNSKLN